MQRRVSSVLVWICLNAICLTSTARDLGKAEELYRRRDFRGSLALLDTASSDAATRFLMGRNYFQLGELKKATDILDKLTQQYPQESEYFDWLGKVYGRRAETANPLTAAGYASKARNAFEQAVKLDAKNKDALSDLFDYYVEAPGFMGGGLDKAAAVAEKNMHLNPPEGLLEQARIAEKRKDLKAAESYLRRSTAAAPKAIGYYVALARFLAKQGRDAEADQVFAEAFKQRPDAPRLWFARAELLIKAERNLEEARNLLTKYLSADLTVDDPGPEPARELLEQLK